MTSSTRKTGTLGARMLDAGLKRSRLSTQDIAIAHLKRAAWHPRKAVDPFYDEITKDPAHIIEIVGGVEAVQYFCVGYLERVGRENRPQVHVLPKRTPMPRVEPAGGHIASGYDPSEKATGERQAEVSSLFDTIQIGGKSVGNWRYCDLRRAGTALIAQGRLLIAIADHCTPADEHSFVRDIISERTLTILQAGVA